MNDLKPALTGREIIEAFKNDVEDFFDAAHLFELRFETSGFSPTCIGSGSAARIRVPVEMLEKSVDSLAELVLFLLVLGHETAHYLHRHNEHDDESSLEHRALERWADFYGTKVAMIVMTIGQKTLEKMVNFPETKNSGCRLDALACALVVLSNSYFRVVSEKYPTASERVDTCVSGMLSFFQLQFCLQDGEEGGDEGFERAMRPETIIKRAFLVQQRLYSNKSLADQSRRSPATDGRSEEIRMIAAVHRKIQNGQPALFQGLKEAPSMWLSLDYEIPEDVLAAIAQKKHELLMSILAEMGLSE